MTIFKTVTDLRLYVSERVNEDETNAVIDEITEAIRDHKYFPAWGEDATEFVEMLNSRDDFYFLIEPEETSNHNKSEAWQTGYESAKQGENLSDNPYEKTLWTHDEWISGYKEFKGTYKTTKDGLRVYDLDPKASELWAVAGPAGYKISDIDPDKLPTGFRWVTNTEWSELENTKSEDRKIIFYTNQNGLKVVAAEGLVRMNNHIIDCNFDFGSENHEEIYEELANLIINGETEGTFSNEYEFKYSWKVK